MVRMVATCDLRVNVGWTSVRLGSSGFLGNAMQRLTLSGDGSKAVLGTGSPRWRIPSMVWWRFANPGSPGGVITTTSSNLMTFRKASVKIRAYAFFLPCTATQAARLISDPEKFSTLPSLLLLLLLNDFPNCSSTPQLHVGGI
jgi:hypothetical protein